MQIFNETGNYCIYSLSFTHTYSFIYSLTYSQCNEYETRLVNTSNAYELSLRQKEQQLQEAHVHCEELSSRLNNSHNRDLQMVKDAKDNEIRELKMIIAQLQDNVFNLIYSLFVILLTIFSIVKQDSSWH